MAWLYGNPVRDVEFADLLMRLRSRGQIESVFAAEAMKRPADRYATADTAREARKAILYELKEWPELDRVAPSLAAVRDHLVQRGSPVRQSDSVFRSYRE